jgi:molecular chaperone Hsp33
VSELQKFLFDGLPVRGMLVRLTDSWREILQRRDQSGGYPPEVLQLLGEMSAAAVLMQSNIKFNGAVVLQIMGDGPVRLAVAEAQPDLGFRATAKVEGAVPEGATLTQLVNVHRQGRCAITLDPKDRLPGQQPYQGVVSLQAHGPGQQDTLSAVLANYMQQSEQLDTQWVLAANGEIAAGLLIQRMPATGGSNLSGTAAAQAEQDRMGENEDYNRIALLAASLKTEELLTLDVGTILHRLFWQEPLVALAPEGEPPVQPRFVCSCSRERVGAMLQSLGADEVESVIAERGEVEVGCDFCGQQYRFDPVDAARLFLDRQRQPPGTTQVQ